MANKGDIIKKYYNEYPQFHVNNNIRLSQLKRNFSSDKKLYREQINNLTHKITNIQNKHNIELKKIHQSNVIKKAKILEKYKMIKNQFDDNFSKVQTLVEDKKLDEELLYNEIIEEFENRRQDSLQIYLDLIKTNNKEIDKEMQVHHDFIDKEADKLQKLKNKYDNLNAELSNKMLWTIEKTKNALTKLKNELEISDKDNLIFLNKKIINSLTELRGTRNDINSLYKTTSANLEDYRKTIYKARKSKQKPFENINQDIIQKLVKQIRLANENKIKYQNIIQADLELSQRKLYPLILKAYRDDNHDLLEKYILQHEIIIDKANFLIEKIEKVTNYNISDYQNRIKKIKIEAFTRNEDIKFTYSIPTQYLENAINIYSNYNFYFNQGFDDLDKLLTQLIEFIQSFNEIKDKQITITKKEFSNYQTNLIAQINQISENLAELLYQIDEISYNISTLESKYRLEVAEIRKDIINNDIRGDYKKYLESLNNDQKIANYNYNTRIRKLNTYSLYSKKVQDIYKKTAELNKQLEINLIESELDKIINQKEALAHKDYYNNLKNQFNTFYKYQTKLSESFIKIIKANLVSNTKRVNYYLAKKFYYHKDRLENRVNNKSNEVINYIKNSQIKINLNNEQISEIVNYLKKSKKRYSHLTYIEKTRLNLLRKIDDNRDQKTANIKKDIAINFNNKKEKLNNTLSAFKKAVFFYKKQLLSLEKTNFNNKFLINNKGFYKNILKIVTNIHYDLIDYSYNYQCNKSIQKLNNFYDDFIFKYTEKSTLFFDKIKKTKNRKNNEIIKDYLIYTIESIDYLIKKYSLIIENISKQKLDKQTKEIAYLKINSDYQKNIINQEFDKIAEKSIIIRDNSKKQQDKLEKRAYLLNKYLENKVIKLNKEFLNTKSFNDNKILYIKKHLTKSIKNNDKLLIKMLKDFDKSIYETQMNLKKDYKLQMKLLKNLQTKINIDFHSENNFIENLSKEKLNNINLLQNQLKSQLDIVPNERQNMLANINNDKVAFFKQHQKQLLANFREIEKEKFTQIPSLEDKIKALEANIKTDYQRLNDKHINLEENFLNQHTLINEKYQEAYNNYINNKITKSSDLENELDSPLKNIYDVQASLISKTNIIYTETKNKTNSTIKKIYQDKQKSENKQKRIINS
ncbi:MAG: hypothetical protein ACQERX_00895 [Bacillota bacterium]